MASLFRRPRSAPPVEMPAAQLAIEVLEDRSVPATLTVTTLSDTGELNDSLVSLREAIIQANADPGADTIVFQDSLSGRLDLASALPTITASLTISGPAAAAIIIDANNNGPIFAIEGSAADVKVFVSELTVTGGILGSVSFSNIETLTDDADSTSSATELSDDQSDVTSAQVETETLSSENAATTATTSSSSGATRGLSNLADNKFVPRTIALSSLATPPSSSVGSDTQEATAAVISNSTELPELPATVNTTLVGGVAGIMAEAVVHFSNPIGALSAEESGRYQATSAQPPIEIARDSIEISSGTGAAPVRDAVEENVADAVAAQPIPQLTVVPLELPALIESPAAGQLAAAQQQHARVINSIAAALSGSSNPNVTVSGTDDLNGDGIVDLKVIVGTGSGRGFEVIINGVTGAVLAITPVTTRQ